MKKFVICLISIFIIFIGICFFKYKTDTVECWWGVLYPSLSYIGFEDEDTMIASLDTNYFYIPDTTIKTKFLIIEWFKNKFSF